MKERIEQEILEFFKNIEPQAFHIDDAAYILQLKGDELATYHETMKRLTDEGRLVTGDGVYYHLPKKALQVEGIYKQHGRNFGFLVGTAYGDIFIGDDDKNNAMNNDKVLVQLTQEAHGKRNAEGYVVKILERSNKKIVGTFQRQKHFAFVTPDDERLGDDIYVELAHSLDARSGAKVLVEITKWPSKSFKKAEGIVCEILGYEGTPGLDVSCIVAQHDLPFEFPPEVLKEAAHVSLEVADDGKRLDLRHVQMVTIDGEDAKDLDDAVSIEVLANGNYRLGVHIADVSHYVHAHQPLDREAYKRGTSVYLVDRVIPMLPHELSNGICSLNAKEDRYAMSCIMDIDKEGKVVHRQIQPSIVHIDRRCNYNEVYKALTEDIIPHDLEAFMPMLHDLYDLSKILLQMRRRRGALDFDFPEYKVIVDDEGTPLRIVQRARTIAERIIEECMLIANETVAAFLRETGNSSVYRIHEVPNEEKLDTVRRILAYLGKEFTMEGDEIQPRDFQQFLRQVAGTDVERVAQYMVLRSMQQARYRVENKGHFGLASPCYTHFTSPIRRYPDLMVHRLVKKALQWPEDYEKRDYNGEFLAKAAEHSSEREQVAVQTERDVDDLKKAQYMESRIGQSFEGHISSITSFGLFVEIDNGIDGLVSLATMNDDYYYYDEEHCILKGRHKGTIYHLGQAVTVTLLAVEPNKGQIDFILGEADPKTLRYAEVQRQKRIEKRDGVGPAFGRRELRGKKRGKKTSKENCDSGHGKKKGSQKGQKARKKKKVKNKKKF